MGNREVPFSATDRCDVCGKPGAYDFMGDLLCSDCASPPTPRELPELPKGRRYLNTALGVYERNLFTADQMHAYARQAIAARLAESEARAEGLRPGDDLDGFDAMARDAARWRWLRPYWAAANFEPKDHTGIDLIFSVPAIAVSGNADKTIDAAIAQEAGREAVSAAPNC